MTTAIAKGTFSVKLEPQPDTGPVDGVSLGRIALDKHYEGDLVATARGEMLTAMTAVKGSAGYVAIERVSGSLQGRSGSFVLQHTGAMNRGAQQLSITIVPDSGGGQLAGISGTLAIRIVDGAHFYELAYALPAP